MRDTMYYMYIKVSSQKLLGRETVPHFLFVTNENMKQGSFPLHCKKYDNQSILC